VTVEWQTHGQGIERCDHEGTTGRLDGSTAISVCSACAKPWPAQFGPGLPTIRGRPRVGEPARNGHLDERPGRRYRREVRCGERGREPEGETGGLVGSHSASTLLMIPIRPRSSSTAPRARRASSAGAVRTRNSAEQRSTWGAETGSLCCGGELVFVDEAAE
jgi:hypothetical protein